MNPPMPTAVISTRRDPLFFDFFCLGKKFLVFNLVSRNIKIKYRRSVLGLLWTLLNPLALTAIYYFVFKLVLKVHVPHYLTFMMSGVMLWSFFAGTVLEGMESVVGNFGLLSKVPIPAQIFPWVGTITNLVTLTLSLPIIIGVAAATDVSLSRTVVLLPFYGAALFLMAYAFALILAVSFVYLRDLRHLVSILMQLWFYGTPVIYDETMVPEKFRWVLLANPVGLIFSGVHDVLLRGQWPSYREVAAVCVWTAVVVGVAMAFQRKWGREMVERI